MDDPEENLGFDNFGQEEADNDGDGLDQFLNSGEEDDDTDIFASAVSTQQHDEAPNQMDMFPNEELGPSLDADLGMNNLGLDENKEVLLEEKEVDLIGEWEREHRAMLLEKRTKGRQEKEAILERARESIEEFYKNLEEKQQNIKSANREAEENAKQELIDVMQHGDAWEKVGRLINLTPKPNEKPGSSKVNRMRGLLIQLKNEKKS